MNEALIADPVRSRQILERIPAQRWGTPADFEGAVVFLASKASDYVSGECLVVDGGWMGREYLFVAKGPMLHVSEDRADSVQGRPLRYRDPWCILMHVLLDTCLCLRG